jgi:hypothetical protein
MRLLMRLLGRKSPTRRDAGPMIADSRQAEISAQADRSDATIARSNAALEIVRELEERLAGNPAYPTFDRRQRQLATAPHRRRTDR